LACDGTRGKYVSEGAGLAEAVHERCRAPCHCPASGARLVGAAEAFARDHACRGIYVDTPIDNDAGRAFYAARGYSEDYRMTRYYADDLDGVTYVKFF
jgi:ribosomal protein S18 acetylase RimI-like enzyme